MKIAYFTDTYLPQINGVTNTLSRLAAYLDHKGIENIIFAPAGNSYCYQTMVDTSFSIRFFLYPECRVSIPNLYRIGKRLAQFEPDLIHCYTQFNMGLAGLNYCRNHGIPAVASYTTNFDQYLDYYNLPFMKKIIWDYHKWFHNQCLVNYAPSRETIDILQDKGITNTALWRRGVDTELYHPCKRDDELRRKWNASEKIVLLYVGRIAAEKNLQLLANSYRVLQAQFGDGIHLVLTGDGPLLPALQQEGLTNVTFTGYKTGEELAQIYASADIFVFPSTTETFGNVVLEAMASGLPVVGFASGGVKELICNGANGVLCGSSTDHEKFAQANVDIIRQSDLRSSLANGARQYALTQSWSSIFASLLDSYQKVAEDGHRWKKSA